jgi:thiamine biosynthesis lipoprotein
MMVVTNTGASAVTSGIYERGFEADGVWYHHILDPKTGWPVQNELASVTILSESSLEGDALSTAVFALGSEKGLALIESLEGTEAILISRDRSVTMSSGAAAYVTQ